MAGRAGSIAQVSSRTEAGSGDKRDSRFTPRIWRSEPDHRGRHRARHHAPSAGEEFACGNLRPETGAGGGFPAGRGGRLGAQPIDTAVLARI